MAVSAAALLAAVTPAIANVDLRANGTQLDAKPVDVWALPNVISNVEISPDGQRVLITKRESKDGENIMEIRELSDLGTPMRRLNADPMDVLSAQWVNDNTLFGTAYQQTRKRVKGQEGSVYDFITFAYNIESDKFSTLSTTEFSKAGGNINVVSLLPAEPDHVLISTAKPSQGVGDSRDNLFRPANFYKLNLKTGSKELLYRGTRERPSVGFDQDGNIISSFVVEGPKVTMQVRAPGERDWITAAVIDQDAIDSLHLIYGFAGPLGILASGDDPNKGVMFTRKEGFDKAGLYEVDLRTGNLGEEIFRPATADAMGLVRSSNSRAGDFRVAAVEYPGAKMERHWLDQKEKALYDKVSRQIPNAHYVTIASRSRDGQRMIVRNTGPKDPGSFYLLDGNKLTALGSRNPLVSANDLNNVEYHIVKARDGLDIPVYVTKPKGEGPWPTVVMPHGGPHVNEVIMYDEWGQMLANNGYLVLQPQYRTSTGLGRKHFEAGYDEHGKAMQDDKDDAALWAVEQGWADPDRLAMHGFSYGGYAAAVAASRENQIYQCAVAGAAVLNAARQVRGFESPFMGKAAKQWGRWRGADSGTDPIKEVSNINIPLYVISGAVDSRVMPYNHTDYEKAVKKAGKDDMVEFLQIKDMDHGGLGMQFHYFNAETYYTELLRFLKEDCGPGGL